MAIEHVQSTTTVAQRHRDENAGLADALGPPGVERMAEVVAATGEYRVLRRLDLARVGCVADDAGTSVGLVCDVETSGLQPGRDRIVELALRRFRYDAAGRLTKLDRSYCWREDPGEPLDPTISSLTGLTDADLAGRTIDDKLATGLLRSADVRICHNARFDRPFIERRLPHVRGLAWACTLHEIDWRQRGFDGGGRSLGWLLSQAGFFHGAHRADGDVDATIALLQHRTAQGRTALAELLETARRPGWRMRAVGAGFDVKDALKGRGYRWDADEKVWSREVADGARAAEEAWLAEHVYAPHHRPRMDGPAIDEVDWSTRHA